MSDKYEGSTPVLLSAEECIDKAIGRHRGTQCCFTSSFQLEDMVVLDLLRARVSDVAVIFLDTGYHFQATYDYRDRMTKEWALNLVNVTPETTVAEHEAKLGKLHIVDPSQCCNLRKVEPLFRSLEPFEVWFTGLRREQSPTRRNMQQFDAHRLQSGKTLSKVSPLAAWIWSDVEHYATLHAIPVLELYGQGYASIGCEPCTQRSTDPNNPRAGRWGGAKLECGIHTFGAKEVEKTS